MGVRHRNAVRVSKDISIDVINDLRKLCENRLYKEIYLKCSINECIKRNMLLNKNEDLLKKKIYVYQEYKSFDLMINTEYASLYTSFNKISKLINVSK